MNDSISRQAAIDALHGYFDGMLETDTWSPCDVYELIEILPSADVQPVRHGQWDTVVEDWDSDEHCQCSECGAEFVLFDGTPRDNDFLYCPHCGARMDGEQDE